MTLNVYVVKDWAGELPYTATIRHRWSDVLISGRTAAEAARKARAHIRRHGDKVGEVHLPEEARS